MDHPPLGRSYLVVVSSYDLSCALILLTGPYGWDSAAEGSVIGGDTTSLLAGAPHSPHRDVNPVPQSHSAPRGTQPLESGQLHHDNEHSGTTETDESVDADDNTHRSSPAPRDHVADTVAPTALSSQAPASDTGGIADINDNASHSGADNAQEQFISPQRRRSQREHLRQQADVILITDSTGKYVDSSRFMGRQNYTFHMRASTSEVVLRDLNRWPANDNVKYIILHNGVNDVRGGKTVSEIVGNSLVSLTTTKKRFPRAKSAYSEMLYIGSEESNPELNRKVKDINMPIKSFSYVNGHYFVAHNALQIGTSDLYGDDVHISRGGGTALFVNDIHKTLTRRNRPPQKHAQGPSGGRVYFGRSDGNRQASSDHSGVRQAADFGPAVGEGVSEPEQAVYRGRVSTRPRTDFRLNNDVDIGQMVKLLTLNLLNSLQSTWYIGA